MANRQQPQQQQQQAYIHTSRLCRYITYMYMTYTLSVYA